MKKVLVLIAMLSLGAMSWADDTRDAAIDRLHHAAVVLHEVMATPDKGIPQEVIDHAKCIAVVPHMIKGGFVFGALRIINIAHGSFYAFGAFGVAALVGSVAGGGRFWLALLVTPLAVAALGAGVEVTVLRRVYARDHLAQLVVTYALFLIFADVALRLWGSQARGVPVPAGLGGSVTLSGGVRLRSRASMAERARS